MTDPRFTITGFSTALFSTWYFVDELNLLLDCGDGACAGLLEKARKVRTIAISHADRDHLAGLGQFLQLNVREKGLPVLLHPRDDDSFPLLKDFLHRFDRYHLEVDEGNHWKPVNPGEPTRLGKAKARIVPIKNRHIEAAEGEVRSLSYRVVRDHHHLRSDYQGKSPGEIAQARAIHGDDAVLHLDEETLLVYSADAPIESPEFWGNTRVLIHEATFLHADDVAAHGQQLRHSALDEVIPMAASLDIECLILGHFSTRYSKREIRSAIETMCRRCGPSFPVFAVLPGEIRRDILRGEPVWSP